MSQSTTTTMSTSLSTTAIGESNEFPIAIFELEVIVLISIIICCPLCIGAFCFYQKRKTKRCAKEHAKRIHALISNGNNEHRKSLKKQESHSFVPLQKMQSRGVMPLPFTQRIASIPTTLNEQTDKVSDSTKKKEKKSLTFSKVLSVSVDDNVMNNLMESASVLPIIEDDVNEPPPKQLPKQKTFDAITGAPIQSNESENDVNLLQIAQDQMSNEQIPSLQTLFGRRVKSKNDSDSSDDDDSLLQRQRDFASENVKNENQMNESEKTENENIVLDV